MSAPVAASVPGPSVMDHVAPATCELIRDPSSLYYALKRLHNSNDAVMFWNAQRSFKLMVRNDPIDAETVSCELLLIYDSDDDSMNRMIDLIHDGYIDEPGSFVLDSWTFGADRFSPDDVKKVMHAINEAYLYAVCPCGRHLIRDDAAMCVFCQMTATKTDHTHFCSICCDNGLAMHMRMQPCCQQHLHAHCLATWRSTSGDARCPLCRQQHPPSSNHV